MMDLPPVRPDAQDGRAGPQVLEPPPGPLQASGWPCVGCGF